ncbi:T9SS type A sorting domain-containing protein [Bacteroidota bacterium]
MKKKNIPSVTTIVLRAVVFTVFICGLGLSFGQQLTGPYLGQTPPGNTPQMFVPNQLRSNADWWWHGALAFTQDGNEFYMDIYVPANYQGIRIRYMEMVDNVWTDPQTPSFAEGFMTASPSFTDNGNTVYFISDRPGGPIWTSTRTQTSWSTPTVVHFPWPANLGGGWEVSATNDGTLYLRMEVIGSQDPDIYCIRCVNGVYSEPERLDDTINSSSMELGPYIDPDEEYLIFESYRPGGYGGSDLYISFKKADGSWTPALNMGEPVNSSAGEGAPSVSPDGLYLFFISDRHQQWDGNPYWVSTQVIEDLRIASDVPKLPIPVPERITLYQNYPNPFNPTTTIEFALQKASQVNLSIYNLLGKKVATLISEKKSPGMYEVEWNASGFASGVYLFRLQTDKGFLQTKKLILLK